MSSSDHDGIVEEVKKSLKDIRKEAIELQKSTLQEAVEANKAALRNQLRVTGASIQKAPNYLGDRYPARPAKPAEAQVKTLDLKFSRTQVTVLDSLGYDKLIPKFTHWTPISRNYKVDDDPVLRHLPYFNDEDNETFDYLSYYDTNSLVENDREDEYRNEAVGIILVLTILKKRGIEEKQILNLIREPKKRASTEEDDKVNETLLALAKVFRVDPETMKERIVTIFENKAQVQEPPVLRFIENLDDPRCDVREEQCLDSFVNLFCRRCFQYDCQLHGVAIENAVYKNKGRYAESYPEDRGPCGPHCAKHLKGQEGEPSSPKKRKLVVEENEWNCAELLLLSKACEIFHQSNSCDMALMVSTKTCQEVHQQLLRRDHHPKTAPEKPDPPGEKAAVRKRKKSRKVNLLRSQGRKIPNLHREGDSESLVEYSPCSHDGPCDDKCPCCTSNNYCEKFCMCDSSCKNRFPGCRCKRNCDTRQCPCFAALRECDPDACGTCGAGEELDKKCRCQNVALQRGLQKHTVVGESEIAGWGLFVREDISKNELIGEYMGEIISQEEADRRGKVYDKHAISFLFNLNQDFCVDAHRKGNKLRFANHSINPNCYARVTMVNGDYRIGIFAKYDINAGEEIFFDYRYGDEGLKFVPVELANTRTNQDSMSDSEGNSDHSDYDF